MIKKEATVCRYCGRDLADVATQTAPIQELKEVSDKSETMQAIKLPMKQQLISLLVGGGLVILFIILWVVMQTEMKTDQHMNASASNRKTIQPTASQQTSPQVTVGMTGVPLKPPPPFITLRRSVWINGAMHPVGTRLEVVFRQGSDVHVRYAGAKYVIPVSATDLK